MNLSLLKELLARRQHLLSPAQIRLPLVLGIATRVWAAFAGLIGIYFITANLTPVLQGYYYTFNSLSQLTQLADLGLQVMIVQFASHEAPNLTIGPKGSIAGSADSRARLMSLARFSLAWYGAVAALLIPGLIAAGYGIFAKSADAGWEGPWLCVSFLVALDLWLSSFVWLLEGMNNLTFVYTYRLTRGVLAPAAVWTLLSTGHGLWAIPVGLAVGISTTLIFLMWSRPMLVIETLRKPLGATISWRREIWPLQWRLGISAITGYAAYSLFVPVTFKFVGPVAAGQFGLSWTLVDTMTSIALAPLLVRFPLLGQMASRRAWAKLDRETHHLALQVITLTTLGALSIVLAAWGLHMAHHPLALRLLPLFALSLLSLTAVVKNGVAIFIYYLRAHRQEPIVALTVTTTILMVATVVIGSIAFGVNGVVLGYFAVMSLVWIPGIVLITRSCRSAWHTPMAGRV